MKGKYLEKNYVFFILDFYDIQFRKLKIILKIGGGDNTSKNFYPIKFLPLTVS